MDPNNNPTGNKTQQVDVSQLGHDSSTVFDGAFCRPGMNTSASHYHNGATTIHSEARVGITPPMFVQTPRAENPSRLEADCYVTILSQTTKLEQSLIIAPGEYPTIESIPFFQPQLTKEQTHKHLQCSSFSEYATTNALSPCHHSFAARRPDSTTQPTSSPMILDEFQGSLIPPRCSAKK